MIDNTHMLYVFDYIVVMSIYRYRYLYSMMPTIIIPFQFYNLGTVQYFVFVCVDLNLCVCMWISCFWCVSVCLCFCIVVRGVLHIVWALLFIVVFDMGNSGAGAANLTTWTLQCLSGEFSP